MLDLTKIPLAELRGVLKATEEVAGKESPAVKEIVREIASRHSLSDYVDRQSVVYLVGTVLAAAGTRLACGDGQGLIVAGVLLIAPILVPLIPRRPVLPGKADSAVIRIEK